jgi:hypothetical protein
MLKEMLTLIAWVAGFDFERFPNRTDEIGEHQIGDCFDARSYATGQLRNVD